MNKRTLGVAAVFLVGCAVGGASSQLVVPKASAQQAATLTKWETFCWLGDWDALTPVAKKASAEGWELTSHTFQADVRDGVDATACFKRPKM